jgi:hypothetical protein
VSAKLDVSSKTRSIRADADAWELLDWWASMLGVPLGSLLRAAMEDLRDEIAATLAPDVDPTLPDTVLLKRVIRDRLRPPKPSGTVDAAPV